MLQTGITSMEELEIRHIMTSGLVTDTTYNEAMLEGLCLLTSF